MSGSDFNTVWARQGEANAQKTNAEVKTRICVVQKAGRQTIATTGKGFTTTKIIFATTAKGRRNAGLSIHCR